MGSNCSCLHGGLIDEKQVFTDKNTVEIDRKALKSLENTSQAHSRNAKDLSIDIRVELSDIIFLQSVLRGYLSRKHVKKAYVSTAFHQETPLNSKNSRFSTHPVRTEVTELLPGQVPSYPEHAVKQILTKIGPFVFRDSNFSGELIKKGPVLLENKAIYIGEWNGNKERHGSGIQKWTDGAVYEGYWKNDKANGKGRLVHANCDVYEGDWVDDKAHGSGFYIHNDGAKYEGSWVNDKQHGKGIEIWPDGAKYHGNYENGLKHGLGVFEWADGSHYNGNFSDNNIHGIGTYNWSDGRKFVGTWKDNKMHGKGLFTWKDGRSYEGEYENDKKHGLGIFKWADGRIYEGDWKDGKQNGKGKYTSPNGEAKEGLWQDGKRVKSLQN